MAATDLHREFLDAGAAARSGSAVEAMASFLDGVARLPSVQAIRSAMRVALLDREAPRAAVALLDAACGIGAETRLLAGSFSGRRVIGLDQSQDLLDVAASRTEPGIEIEWRRADVRATGLDDASVAAVRVERGLIYLADAEVAVAEFARVLAPGGVVVAYELDYGGLVLPLGDASPALMREVNDVMEASLPGAWVGRRLPRWLADAGFTGVTATPMTIALTPATADRIVGDTIRGAVADGRLRDDALGWLDSLAHEPAALPSLTVVGFVTTGVAPR